MREVTKEQFYATVGQMDVHPRTERDHAAWETRDRRLVGRTEPGYMLRDKDGNYTNEKRYWVNERLISA